MTTRPLFAPAPPSSPRTRKRAFDRALYFSLLLSLLLHAGAAGVLLARPDRAELVLQLQSGEEALDLDVGSAFDSAPSPPSPEIPEARFAEPQAALPPDEKFPDKEDAAQPAASDLRGALAILEKETREREESDPVPEETLTRDAGRRYHRLRMLDEPLETTAPEALAQVPEPVDAEPPEDAASPSEAREASLEAVKGAEAKPRGVIQRARPMGSLVPVYPEYSRRMGEMGEVIIRAGIDALGRCSWAKVERSSGYAALDVAALDTVRRARFAPASEDGMPIAMEDRFLIEFQLR